MCCGKWWGDGGDACLKKLLVGRLHRHYYKGRVVVVVGEGMLHVFKVVGKSYTQAFVNWVCGWGRRGGVGGWGAGMY